MLSPARSGNVLLEKGRRAVFSELSRTFSSLFLTFSLSLGVSLTPFLSLPALSFSLVFPFPLFSSPTLCLFSLFSHCLCHFLAFPVSPHLFPFPSLSPLLLSFSHPSLFPLLSLSFRFFCLLYSSSPFFTSSPFPPFLSFFLTRAQQSPAFL